MGLKAVQERVKRLKRVIERPVPTEEVLQHWNSKDIIKHKPTLRGLGGALLVALENYTVKEIKQAIDNYDTVLKDDEYRPFPTYQPYIWNLPDFLRKSNALPEYMPGGAKWLNYLRYKERQATKKEIEPPKQEAVSFSDKTTSDLYEELLRQFREMPYSQYLKTEHWRHFRKQALRFAHYSCQLCGATAFVRICTKNY